VTVPRWGQTSGLTSQPRYLEFDPLHLAEVLAAMSSIADTHEGWVNFEPAVHVEDAPPPDAGFFSLFSGRGPAVPLGTWTPPSAPRRGRVEPAMLGLQHSAGGKARPVLERLGHPVPDGWPVTQDYAKKGMVVAVPPAASTEDAVRWLLTAASLLSSVPLTGRWRAAVYGA